jgi:hypothetical protein
MARSFGLTLTVIVAGMIAAGSVAAITSPPSASCPGRSAVVLGSEPPHSISNWGKCKPSWFSNGGDADGTVSTIHWVTWGGPVATGRGVNARLTPVGGYYPLAVIYLRAFDLGKCSPSGPRAYRHLYVRQPLRPGGPLSRWHEWNGNRNECHG